MKANYKKNQGDVSVIRPLVYCRESLMTEFVSPYVAPYRPIQYRCPRKTQLRFQQARNANLPVINENCPACFEEPTERARVKKLLSWE